MRVHTPLPYDVIVGEGMLREAGPILEAAGLAQGEAPGPRSAVIVTNPTVAQHWLEELEAGLHRIPHSTAMVGDGERHKTLATVAHLYDSLIDRGCDRQTVIVTLGGGVVCDIGGFVAATYLRGVPLVHVPTTLLAQVDASVGGKTGVDHPRGKNLIGAFYQPRAVICDVRTLTTLPEPVYRDGLAEAVKTALVGGEQMLRSIETSVTALVRRDPATLRELVEACVRTKAGIVERDERDTGQRMALNLGHTFGHAIEAAVGFGAVSHGAAVSVGMCIAGRLAALCGIGSQALADRTERLLVALGLPVRLSQLPGMLRAADLMPPLIQDKKRVNGKQRYVLARGPGDIIVTSDVDERLVDAARAWAEGDDRR